MITLDLTNFLLIWLSLSCQRLKAFEKNSFTASLEERVSQLEITVAELEESLVEDYGLIKRCRMPTFEHGVASCNHLGNMRLRILDTNEGLCVDLTPGKVCKALCDAGWIQTPGIQRSLYLL